MPLRLLGVLVLVEVDDRDVGALLGEDDRDGAADAAVAAGDERDLAAQLAAGPVLAVLGLRPRRHLRLDAGPAVLVLRRLLGFPDLPCDTTLLLHSFNYTRHWTRSDCAEL